MKWLTDVTEFQIPAGKVYMLDAAIETVASTGDLPIVHSGRGAYYRWPGWLSRIAGAKLVRSMSCKGTHLVTLRVKAFWEG